MPKKVNWGDDPERDKEEEKLYKPINKVFYGKATWTTDPLHWVECPHCKNVILMGTPTLVKRLKKWAKKLNRNSKK